MQLPLKQPRTQVCPQAPQFVRSVSVFTQVLSHSVRLPLHWHWPLLQFWSNEQVSPQPPQLFGLLLVSTQVLPHGVRLALQLFTHWFIWFGADPDEQTVPASQTMPQPPQFWLVVTSVHRLPHRIMPFGQVQTFATQVVPPEQTWPQPPQFLSLVLMSTQDPPHSRSCVGQTATQSLCVQYSAGMHFLAHAPQLLWSVVRSMQTPLQRV